MDTSAPNSKVSSFGTTRPSASLQRNIGWVEARKRNARVELRRLFIQCNLSFNLLRAPQWKKAINAVAMIGEPYDFISFESMRDRELKEEVNCVTALLEPLKEDWKKYGVSILSDGWSDIKKRPIINILVSCCTGTTFLRAIDASGAPRIDAKYVFGHIKQAILDVGKENVVQVSNSLHLESPLNFFTTILISFVNF